MYINVCNSLRGTLPLFPVIQSCVSTYTYILKYKYTVHFYIRFLTGDINTHKTVKTDCSSFRKNAGFSCTRTLLTLCRYTDMFQETRTKYRLIYVLPNNNNNKTKKKKEERQQQPSLGNVSTHKRNVVIDVDVLRSR